jgi:hypothetical protein
LGRPLRVRDILSELSDAEERIGRPKTFCYFLVTKSRKKNSSEKICSSCKPWVRDFSPPAMPGTGGQALLATLDVGRNDKKVWLQK